MPKSTGCTVMAEVKELQRNPNMLGCLYLLRPMDVASKAQLRTRFLGRKQAEYDTFRAEIEVLPELK